MTHTVTGSSAPIPPATFIDVGRPSLRDQFAMAALTGTLADSNSRGSYEFLAKEAYRFADAMLKVREEKP